MALLHVGLKIEFPGAITLSSLCSNDFIQILLASILFVKWIIEHFGSHRTLFSSELERTLSPLIINFLKSLPLYDNFVSQLGQAQWRKFKALAHFFCRATFFVWFSLSRSAWAARLFVLFFHLSLAFLLDVGLGHRFDILLLFHNSACILVEQFVGRGSLTEREWEGRIIGG